MAVPLALAVPAVAQETPAEGVSENEIIVTGTQLKDSLRALEDCLDRGCSPEEDIRLSLAHAENQFLEGIYKDSQRTLRGSIRRTRDAADDLPVPVAGLYRASSRIAEHLGEAKDFQLATLDMLDTLEDGLGKDDPRTLVAEITVGDSRAKLGQPDDARRIYKRVEERAIGLGFNRVASFARLHNALLWQAEWEANKKAEWRYDNMVEQLTQLRDNPLLGGEEFVLVAQVMQARIDRELGKDTSTEDLVRQFAESGGVDRPVLLASAPLYTNEDRDREAARASSAAARLSTQSRDNPQWVDVGFWINPEGRVEDFEILRSEGETGWVEQIQQHINSRRYAPINTEAGTPGFYQIERYTLTARYADQTTGTRLRKREPTLRIEKLDITPENYTPPAES